MTTIKSNSKQRRNALLRAIILVLVAMIFTGFGVSLFPTGKYLETEQIGSDCQIKSDSLSKLSGQVSTLTAELQKIDVLYDSISHLDQNWKREQKLLGNNPALKKEINSLEKQLEELVYQLYQKQPNDLGALASQGWTNLIVCRDQLWYCRSQLIGDGGGGSGAMKCEEEIRDLRLEAMRIASAIEEEANQLEDANIRGGLGNRREVKEKIKNATAAIRRIANRVRNL